jgi:hypothetical protein
VITASLVSGPAPQRVQIVIDEAPAGERWTVVGRIGEFTGGLAPSVDLAPSESLAPSSSEFVAGGYSWVPPGGTGIGDGDQVVLTDNRAPGNVPVVYSLVTEAGEEYSETLRVVFPAGRDTVLQSGDGQRSLAVSLLAGSDGIELPTNVASFRIPGRARPVVRYDVLGDVVSTMNVLVPIEEKTPFRELLGPGEPIIYRLGAERGDLDRVAVIQILGVVSTRLWQQRGLREWQLAYQIIDDPWADVRLGAFSWADFNAAFAGRSWADFNGAFTGADWAAFNRTDWTAV